MRSDTTNRVGIVPMSRRMMYRVMSQSSVRRRGTAAPRRRSRGCQRRLTAMWRNDGPLLVAPPVLDVPDLDRRGAVAHEVVELRRHEVHGRPVVERDLREG